MSGQTANAWGNCCETVIGNGPVIEKEKRFGGAWVEESILLGFHVDVQTKRIRLPGANIEGAWLTVTKPVFNAGNTAILLKYLQELRGLFTHYSNCNQLWKTLAQPIDAPIAYPDESSLWAICEDSDLWQSFWNMSAFLRNVMGNHKDRTALFEGSLMDFLPDPVRLSGPAIRKQIC